MAGSATSTQHRLASPSSAAFGNVEDSPCNAESTLDQLAEAMAEHPRAADVYVGVDVFGRNTSYQGGAESDQAVRAVVSRGLSCALFAPGETHRCLP